MSTNLPRLGTTAAAATDAADIVAGATNALVAIDAKGMLFAQGLLASRPAASIQGRIYWATDVDGGRPYYDTGSAWKLVEPTRAIVTTLPSSPYEGQEVFFQTSAMASAGWMPWHLRYSSSGGALPWQAVGSAAMYGDTGGGSLTGAGAISLSGFTNTPIALPLAGEYRLEVGIALIAWIGVSTPTTDMKLNAALSAPSVTAGGAATGYGSVVKTANPSGGSGSAYGSRHATMPAGSTPVVSVTRTGSDPAGDISIAGVHWQITPRRVSS